MQIWKLVTGHKNGFKAVINVSAARYSSVVNKSEISLTKCVNELSKELHKPSKIYESLVERGHINHDEQQRKVIDLLDNLQEDIKDYSPNKAFFSFFSSRKKSPKGLYLYGNVGTGKTLIMDLFYHSSNVTQKKRIHFHEFMLNIHSKIHQHKLSLQHRGDKKSFDPIRPVADDISSETWLLCFDEFQVTDIADAMILKRLFSRLFENGVVMFATSNRPPDDLYKGGLQRSNFLPFIDDLKMHCLDYCIDSFTDYRLLGKPSSIQTYFLSSHDKTTDQLNELFIKFAQQFEPNAKDISSKTLRILGRDFTVPKYCNKVADFTFEELCMKPLGAVDYIELTKHFRIIILRNIPQLNIFRKREARRLITLLDTFYDAKIGLIISGEVPDPLDLFVQASMEEKQLIMLENSIILDDLKINQEDSSVDLNVFSGEEEEFAFKRAVSRLNEMQTEEYWNDCFKIL